MPNVYEVDYRLTIPRSRPHPRGGTENFDHPYPDQRHAVVVANNDAALEAKVRQVVSAPPGQKVEILSSRLVIANVLT